MSATHRTKEEKLESTDAYYTQPGLARQCIKALVEDGWVRWPERTRVLEPHCGRGAWVDALLKYEFKPQNIWANDIDLGPYAERHPPDQLVHRSSVDALRLNLGNGPAGWGIGTDLICGNPPYNDAGPHIEAGLSYLTPMGVLAYLLPIGWVTARGKLHSRIHWVRKEAKPSHAYLVTPRPKFREGPGTDSATYSLLVWAPGHLVGEPTWSLLDWYDEREADLQLKKLGS